MATTRKKKLSEVTCTLKTKNGEPHLSNLDGILSLEAICFVP